ncbi:hypothetical protein ACFO6R_13350 [Eubacterium multiforme]|uniref:Uncharacterized protein n=1 Tax=Eubacterium multiforme TaxID=83339 RepID=A0ABT9UXX4_9FIRM|nr:hypothetical protein [Eubacterium multiforme]MDQ0151169.1 hypothetical protein [Eubacterium multiforme]
MGAINTILDKVVPRVQAREGKGKTLIDIIQEEIEKEKNLSETDQSKQIGTNETIIEDIIPLHCDIDNGQVYDINTGKVVKEL